jgi:exonuclease SbcD
MDINGYGYGPDVDYPEGNHIGVHIAHGMLLDHRPPFDRYSDLYKVDTTADIILTGHDHLGYGIYHRSADDKLFVNPGSLLRMSASVNEMERQIQVALIKIDEISGKYEAEFIPVSCAKSGEEVLDRSRIEEEKERQYAMDNFSALIQGHTGNKVLMDINQIIDQVAAEEKYSPEVVKTALQIIDRQRELVAV